MNLLANIRLNQFHEKARDLLIRELTLISQHKGDYCYKCNIIQGDFYNGFPEYYCDHLSNTIKRKLKKENKKTIKFLIESLDIIRNEDVQEEF